MICGNILGSITERKKKKENPTHSMIYKNMGVSTYSSPRPQATLLTLNATRISIKGQRQGCRSPKVFTSGFSDLTTHHVMKKTRAQTRQCLGFPSLCATLVLCIHNSKECHLAVVKIQLCSQYDEDVKEAYSTDIFIL